MGKKEEITLTSYQLIILSLLLLTEITVYLLNKYVGYIFISWLFFFVIFSLVFIKHRFKTISNSLSGMILPPAIIRSYKLSLLDNPNKKNILEGYTLITHDVLSLNIQHCYIFRRIDICNYTFLSKV